MSDFTSYMPAALAEARAAAALGEVPIGAVVVDPRSEAIVSAAGNRPRALSDPTAHAEILAIRAAGAAIGSQRLIGLDLWVTLEPCPMCAAAIAEARIARLYYGAEDEKGGGVAHGPRIFDDAACRWRPEVYSGFAAEESAALLRTFFEELRGD